MQFVDDGSELTTFEEPKANERYVHTKYGFSIKLERRDPYGFIYVVWNKGAVPESLSGAYQTYDIAKQAVTNYLDASGFNKVVDEKPEYDKAVYKKNYRKTEKLNDS